MATNGLCKVHLLATDVPLGRKLVAGLAAPLVEPLHRGDHADHQQRDEQDQADVLHRPLPPLGGQVPPQAVTEVEGGEVGER